MMYALDTNIISFYLKGNETVANNISIALMSGNDVVIAPIAYYEVRRGLLAVCGKRWLEKFDNLCALLGVGTLNNDILDAAAEIYAEQRKIGRPMQDADIFIAAFCRVEGFTLVTNNTKHFEYVSGLRLCDWTYPETT
jgi:predicted nucleic acid-binding protein